MTVDFIDVIKTRIKEIEDDMSKHSFSTILLRLDREAIENNKRILESLLEDDRIRRS